MPRKTKAPKPAKTPATTTPAASQFKVGDLVQFYCPTSGKIEREEVAGFVPEHNWVTLASGRHFPAKEISAVVEP